MNRSEKMQAALELCKRLFDDGTICTDEYSTAEDDDKLTELKNAVEIALALPRRNCDVGTAEAQEERYKVTGEVYHTLTLTNVLAWAQMPYTESEAANG